MRTMKRLAADPGRTAALGLALVFCSACTWASYAHWANFEYQSFDLAYYVQALWQLIHGQCRLLEFHQSIATEPNLAMLI